MGMGKVTALNSLNTSTRASRSRPEEEGTRAKKRPPHLTHNKTNKTLGVHCAFKHYSEKC